MNHSLIITILVLWGLTTVFLYVVVNEYNKLKKEKIQPITKCVKIGNAESHINKLRNVPNDLKFKDTEIDIDEVKPIPVNMQPFDCKQVLENFKELSNSQQMKDLIKNTYSSCSEDIDPNVSTEYKETSNLTDKLIKKEYKKWHEMPSAFIECDCKSELIRLVYDADSFDGTVFLYLSIFTEYYNDWSTSWKTKLRHIWYIIRHGSPWADQISLRTHDIKKLRDYLNSLELNI